MPRTTAVRTPPSGVDAEAPAPARLPDPQPVPDHPDLAEREAQEHADRVQRDQRVGVAAEGPQDPEGDGREQHDPPRVRQPVAAERELAGHVAVLGQDRGEAREGVEARVRGEEQDQRGARRERVEERRTLAEGGLRREGHDRLVRPRRSVAGRTRPRRRSARRRGSRAGSPWPSSCSPRSSLRAA